jgi:hypothetical protein
MITAVAATTMTALKIKNLTPFDRYDLAGQPAD